MSCWEAAWRLFLEGGPTMPPLLLISVLLWINILAKLRWLFGMRKESLQDLSSSSMLKGHGDDAPEKPGPKETMLRSFLWGRTGSREADLRLWRSVITAFQGNMFRHLTLITVLAAAAPLLGLLGTVNGMINTFGAIQHFGTGNAQAMASGISEALISTQTGLIVAIPGLMTGHYLRRQVIKESQKLTAFQQMVEGWLMAEGAKPCPA